MFTVAALYRFAPFDHPASLRQPLLELCQAHGICGTILLAGEGVNGTIAGSADGVAAIIAHIRTLPGCADLDVKYSRAAAGPFQRMKVRLKREIVSLKVSGIDPSRDVGAYVDPADWNAVVDDPGTIVIDTRNGFEVGYGSFAGAIDPGTTSFGEFPDWWRAHADQFAGKRIAMFCTGGIRCEKSTAFLRAEGVEDVVHLKGGILNYLEKIPETESRWHGSCFVFDERVSVGHELVEVGEKN
ncbi:MAG: rhodanese-related sulfurtransferase [Sphingopyxis sp.]|nr:rhodanese-related sulfurtransferase [Sphingopyxis sp.]